MQVNEELLAMLTETIDAMPFSARTSNILKRFGVRTVIDLLGFQENELRGLKGVGDGTMAEVRSVTKAHLAPIFMKYSRAEIGQAIKETKRTRSDSFTPEEVIIDNQFRASFDDPIETLPLSIRCRNALIRGGIRTVVDFLSLSDEDIRGIRNIGPKSLEEIQTLRQNLTMSVETSAPSENKLAPTRFQEIDQSSQKHLLVRSRIEFGDECWALQKLDQDLVDCLKDAGIHCDKDMLQSSLYHCAKVKDVSIDGWMQIYRTYKEVYRRSIPWAQNLPIQGKQTYEIEQLGLSRRTLNRILFTGIVNFQQLLQLTFADILVIKEFGPTAFRELFSMLQNRIDKINIASTFKEHNLGGQSSNLPQVIIKKLIDFGIEDLDVLDQYTIEDLVVKVGLTYLESQQISEFLITLGKTLSERWPEYALVQFSDYQFLENVGVPLERISVSRLALPINLERELQSLRIDTVDAAAKQSSAVLKLILGRRSNEYTDILATNLKKYLAWLPSQGNWDSEIECQGISPLYFMWMREAGLEKIVNELVNLIIHERNRKVIRLRFGLDGGGKRTLQEVGEQIGVTRERIRQIEKRSLEKLRKGASTGLTEALLISVEKEMRIRGGLMSVSQIGEYITDLTEIGEIDLDGTISLLLGLSPGRFVQVQRNKRWGLKDVALNLIKPVSKQLIRILQSVNAPLSEPDLIKRFKQIELYPEDELQYLVSSGFLIACLSTDDRFEETGDNEWGLTRWKNHRTDEIVMALRKLGKPSHFKEIAKVANEMLPPSQRASDRLYHAQLGNKPHLFVWVGSGTFGLVEWGLKRVRFYVDIAEELLQQQGKPMTFDEIFPVVNAERDASPQSILFMLGTNPRFYRYSDNKYGLASWVEEADDESDDQEDDLFLDNLKQQLFDDLFDD